jgi:hypothetical protein
VHTLHVLSCEHSFDTELQVTQELAVKLMQLAQEQGSQQQQQQQQPMQQGSQQGQSQPQQPQQPAMPAAFLAAPEAERGAFLRLTQFSHYSQSPMRQPVRFRAFPKLAQVSGAWYVCMHR